MRGRWTETFAKRAPYRFAVGDIELSGDGPSLSSADENLSWGASGPGCDLYGYSLSELHPPANRIFEEAALAHASLRSGRRNFSHVPVHAGCVRDCPSLVIPLISRPVLLL